jgi:hypothetical protein
MTLDEAIKHCEEVANDRAGCCEDCAEEHRQLAEWLTELVELRGFVRFVTSEVVDDAFRENADCFAEVICRKLIKLGYVEIKGDTYLDIANVKKIDENNQYS